MINLDNGGRLVESVAELPDLRNAKKLFADFETTSGDDKLDALNPWHNCKVAGIGITIDDAQGAWYIPIGHRDSEANLPREPVEKWWQSVASTADAWVNQNVKYDAHVSALDLGYLPEWPRQKLVCTLTRAKIHDSDRGFGRGGYTLDALTRDWLGYEIGGYESEIKKWLGDSKDYGVVPPEIMAPYGCQDAMSVRHLDAYLEAQLHQECWGVAHMEVDLTSVLLGMERRGMRVDMTELKVAELLHGMRLMEIDDELRKLTGRCLNPSSSDQVYDLLCCQYGLPVLRWTEEDDDGNPAGNPSFDKFALEMYASHPLRPRGPNGEEIIGLVQEARTLTQLLGLFVRPYQKLAVKGSDGCWYLHPSTNQLVRTGRMSMSDPNMQQLSKLAKKLIHPSTRGAYLSLDQCLPAGTMLPTIYGDKPIEEVAAKLLPVLGYTEDGQLKFCDVSRGARIGHGPIWRITFDDGTTFECTPGHGFMSYDGERVNCEDLKPGDRLRHVADYGKDYPYWQVHDVRYRKHVTVAEYMLGEMPNGAEQHVHHKDEDKANWIASNLEVKSVFDHLSDHAKENYVKQDHTLRLERLRKSMEHRTHYGEFNSNWQGGKLVKACEWCGDPMEIWPSQAHIKYCSVTCRSYGRSENRQREWDDGTRTKTEFEKRSCVICSAEFETQAFKAKQTCSQQCAGVLRYKNREQNYRVVKTEYVRDDWYYSITVPETGKYVTKNGLVNLNSQVEFRVIVHYIQNQRCIDAYLKDPDTDFHKYIAEGACMARKPAKTMNFLMGFGGGKKLAIKRLSINSDVIGAMEKDVDDRIRRGLIDPANRITAIEQACKAKGESVYDDYHRFLPELKPTSRRAAAVCHERGYVRNWHGRHRRLPPEISHLAFNTLCQGEAADIQKERTVAAARACLGTEIGLVGNVHDEAVFDGPAEQMADPRTQAAMCWMMETIDNPLRVPLRASVGYSDKSWWEASTDVKDGGTSGPLHYDATTIDKDDPLKHLR